MPGSAQRAGSSPGTPLPGALREQVDGFLAYLELERGLSRNTLAAYQTDLLQFAETLFRGGDYKLEWGGGRECVGLALLPV